jgi:hypothetical protein
MTVAPSKGAPVAATPPSVDELGAVLEVEVLLLPPPPQADKKAATQMEAVVFSNVLWRINFPKKIK